MNLFLEHLKLINAHQFSVKILKQSYLVQSNLFIFLILENV